MSLKSDLLDWKAHPITKMVFEEYRLRAELLRDQLERDRSLNQAQFAFLQGYLASIRDFENVDLGEDVDGN